jgi:hypothetical protein
MLSHVARRAVRTLHGSAGQKACKVSAARVHDTCPCILTRSASAAAAFVLSVRRRLWTPKGPRGGATARRSPPTRNPWKRVPRYLAMPGTYFQSLLHGVVSTKPPATPPPRRGGTEREKTENVHRSYPRVALRFTRGYPAPRLGRRAQHVQRGKLISPVSMNKDRPRKGGFRCFLSFKGILFSFVQSLQILWT